MKYILVILVAMLLSSCDSLEGQCGKVVGGDIRDNGTCYLRVDFGDKTRNVTVDAVTWINYCEIGSYICFD